jgi:hypothetical protein
MRARYWVGATVFIAVAVVAALKLAGSVLVLDPERNVESARVVTSDGRAQPLYSLPGNRFYTVPKLEGEIEVRCRDGSTVRGGYVTPHMETRLEVKSGSECRFA